MSADAARNAVAAAAVPAPGVDAEAATATARLDRLRPALEAAAPPGYDVDALVVAAWHLMRRTPDLVAADWSTLAGALLTTCQLGLELGPLEHAWIIPRRNRSGRVEATFQLGYKGAAELARRSGLVGSIRTGAVYDWAEVDEQDGTDPHLVVRPIRPRPDGATPVGYWCVVELLEGADLFAVMERSELEAIRDGIPGANRPGSAWREHFDAMARVTVFRRLRGMLPMSTALARAFAADGNAVDQADALEPTSALGAGDIRPVGAEGDTPDGEPFPIDPPADGELDAVASSSSAPATPVRPPEPETAGVEDTSDTPRVRMAALRTWANDHELGDVIAGERSIDGGLDALAATLGVDAADVARLITTGTPPEHPDNLEEPTA